MLRPPLFTVSPIASRLPEPLVQPSETLPPPARKRRLLLALVPFLALAVLALLLALRFDLPPFQSLGAQTHPPTTGSNPSAPGQTQTGTVLSMPFAAGSSTLASKSPPQAARPDGELVETLQQRRASETAGSQVLTKFFAANDIETKLSCILDPASAEPSLRSYYQDPNRWEHGLDLQPFAYPQGREDKEQGIFPFVVRPASKLSVGTLSEELEDSRLRPTIAYVKKDGNRFALDWPTYRQTRHHSWDRFLSSKTAASEEFRLVSRLTRPKTSDGDAVIAVFGVTLPHLPVFLQSVDTPAYQTLLAGLEPGVPRFVTLRLRLQSPANSDREDGAAAASPAIEVEEFISWGFLGLHASSGPEDPS